MPNYFLIAVYISAFLSIFIIPSYLKLRRDRIIFLSFLPMLFVGISIFVVMLIASFWDDTSFAEAISWSFFIFFEILLFGYIMMFPIALLAAFVVEYLRVHYHYLSVTLAFVGGGIGAIVVGIFYMEWKFVVMAFFSGFVAVLTQVYLTHDKNSG